MKSTPTGEPDAGAPASPEPSRQSREQREGHRMIRCRRCREPLFFPTGYWAQHRAPILFCRKCGAQTKVPMRNRWIFAVLAALIFIAAWVFVILIWMKEDAMLP